MYSLTSRIDLTAFRPQPSPAGSAADLSADREFRLALVRLGSWLGWASIAAVLAGVALDGRSHRLLLVALTLGAAAGNAIVMLLPWSRWLEILRGRLLLDLWSVALIGFVALLVIVGGVEFSLLAFLTVPFLGVVHLGWRRQFWLAASLGTCAGVAAIVGVPAGMAAMRLALVVAVVTVAVILARAIKREAAARREAVGRAELERTFAAEANHRITNNLQILADLLLLDRPVGERGLVFDDTAARIQSIAALHRLLAGNERPSVDASALLASIAASAPVPVSIDANDVSFDSATAQKVGLLANELITNAYRHGAEPITVSLGGEDEIVLRVDDAGHGRGGSGGLGLTLVRQIAERGLGGSFELTARADGGTRAEVVFAQGSRSGS